ncbi:ABC transporter ATP-binding protein/permease [Chitinophagaceae bacterium LB-8]|uniref:ABC transporter ATP-binding protein/permease n=1 Tax=Paraflavisolibacter caeni TaxID=2982496 RepID=A0A9X3BER0_9BACT|nr:ABC transporter ATP-binding protein [Paraflavisolibacter caeni]MCU7547479.1 ABC transporter ATP-binding protein/permease [Paraflavisolibacter caeni]
MSSTPTPKKNFDLAILKRVLSFARPYRSRFYISIAFAIVLAAFTPVRPYLIQLTVNKYISNHWANALINITIIQILFLLLETWLRFYFSYITSWLGQAVVKDMRVTVYEKVLHLNLRQFDRTPIGTLTTRTVDDIERINDIFAEGLIPILADLLSIICVLGYMIWVDWRLTLICLIPFPLLILGTYYFKESVNKSFHRVRNAVSSLNAFVQEHLTGMQIVQAFAREKKEFEKFDEINKEHRNANIKAIFAYSVFFPLVEIILATSIGLIVWFGSKEAVEAGTITAFILCLNLLFRPLRIIADKFNVLQMGIISSERVFKVLDNEDFLPPSPETAYKPKKVKGKIEFDRVWFGYVKDQPVLKDVSFIAQPGETVAIVGHTGSGKTTIISLLNRLYQINSGQILIDDVSVDQWDTETLRKNIGVVLQDVFLFAGTVMDNVTLRNTDISREKVEEAAKLIDMHEFIMRLPGGYDYNVMERGATLSLGQRQLLSFIRALLYNPSILILDEATSSVDTESEQKIQKAIDTLISNRTSIIIAHRLSTIQRADKIIVLDKGEIKEIGSHTELLQKGGFYAKLHQMQFEKKAHTIHVNAQ